MSRAFVKENDDGPEPRFDRPVSDAPNYVTPRGRMLLTRALTRAQERNDEREIKYYTDRLATAILVEPTTASPETVAFGTTVTAHDPSGATLRVRIVGEDEAEPTRGAIAWESPIARALMDRRIGDCVTVQRPAGPIEYTIDAIEYEA